MLETGDLAATTTGYLLQLGTVLHNPNAPRVQPRPGGTGKKTDMIVHINYDKNGRYVSHQMIKNPDPPKDKKTVRDDSTMVSLSLVPKNGRLQFFAGRHKDGNPFMFLFNGETVRKPTRMAFHIDDGGTDKRWWWQHVEYGLQNATWHTQMIDTLAPKTVEDYATLKTVVEKNRVDTEKQHGLTGASSLNEMRAHVKKDDLVGLGIRSEEQFKKQHNRLQIIFQMIKLSKLLEKKLPVYYFNLTDAGKAAKEYTQEAQIQDLLKYLDLSLFNSLDDSVLCYSGHTHQPYSPDDDEASYTFTVTKGELLAHYGETLTHAIDEANSASHRP